MEGSRGKEAGTTIGSNEDRSSRRKKQLLSRVFLQLPFAFFGEKGTVSLFPGAGFSGLRSVWGGGTSYPRDRLSSVLLFFFFFLLFPPSPGIGDGGGGLVRASFCVLTFGAWQG